MALSVFSPIHSFVPTLRAVGDSLRRTPRAVQILHITGELTNPVLLENFIIEHPMVHSAIMFGHGRYNAGLLIELEDSFKIDTSDLRQVEETRNKLQPVIDRMNMFAPQHARVQKEMIIFAGPTKPFVHNPFNTRQVNRQDTLAEYNDEIKGLYKAIARATNMTLKPPKIWSPENSLIYVRGIIVVVLGKKLDDDADLFNYGMDSLQATRIRIILFHALHTTAKADTRKLSGDIVYQYRTITGLAIFATRTALACFLHRTESSLARCLEMTKRVESYSHTFPDHHPTDSPPYNDVVLITGTTGLFGSNLLAQFLKSPRVTKVYALNRKKSRPASVVERQASLLQASGLDPALARHPKLTILQGDARHSNLGLPHDIHEELLSSVTHIVHNAWLSKHDRHSPLSVFDGSFRMLRNLIDFALASPLSVPPRLLFVSTTNTLRGTSTSAPKSSSEQVEDAGSINAPEGPGSACDAAGDAYGESKWVGEQILAAAASETPLRPIIVRVGPLCGSVNGRWREDDPFPKIVHLGVALGALPTTDEVVHWIPVHIAARAIAEMRNSLSTYLHVTHPHPTSSLALLRCVGEELHLPLIPLAEWTAKLEAKVHATHHTPSVSATVSASASKLQDPALTLLRHLRQATELATMAAETTEMTTTATSVIRATNAATAKTTHTPQARIFNHVRIASDEAWFASPTLHGGVSTLGIEDVRLWVRHWREVGAIPDGEEEKQEKEVEEDITSEW